MTILLPTTNSQAINFIPREGTIASLSLEREDTNTVESVTIGVILTVENYNQFNVSMTTLLEGKSYILRAYSSSNELLWSDKAFCTAQTVGDYSINNAEFTENTTNQNYVTYEG